MGKTSINLTSCKAMLPTLGPSWAQLPRQMSAHLPKLRTLSPTCIQTCSHWAMLDPSWARLRSKLESAGPSSAQVWPQLRPNLRPRTAKFESSRLGLGEVRPRVSSVSESPGAGGSRREEATRISLNISIYEGDLGNGI